MEGEGIFTLQRVNQIQGIRKKGVFLFRVYLAYVSFSGRDFG